MAAVLTGSGGVLGRRRALRRRPVSARTTESAVAPARRRQEELICVGQEMKEARRKDTTVS